MSKKGKVPAVALRAMFTLRSAPTLPAFAPICSPCTRTVPS